MKTRFPIVALAVFLLFSVAAFADSISGSATATWQPFPSTLNTLNNPYWDGKSMDGTNKNIGHWLTNTGAFTGSTAGPGAMQWWGLPTGNGVDTNFFFQQSASSTESALHVEIAGYSGINIFGWYDVNTPTTLNVIFPGPAPAGGAPVTFTPSASYGFYLQVGVGGPVYYTQSSLNPTGDTGHQHFVIFSPNPNDANPMYWIGVEDLKNAGIEGSGDYNDMIISTQATVPEPGSLALFGTGLMGLATILRYRLR